MLVFTSIRDAYTPAEVTSLLGRTVWTRFEVKVDPMGLKIAGVKEAAR